MRHKLRLLNLILIGIFIFSFTGCVTYKLPNNVTDKTASETTAAAETTQPAETATIVKETIIPDTTTLKATVEGKIAFESNRDGNYEIYIMNVDGSELVNLTNNPADDHNPSFSPDGSKIAFESNRDGNYEIYIMNVDGSEQVRLTNNPGFDEYPCFSPDGSKIAWSKIAFNSNHNGNYEIYIMDVDGSDQVNLTINPPSDEFPQRFAGDIYPSFSPDGSKIAFSSDRDGKGNYEIYIMNIDGSEQTRLTNNQGFNEHPSFSPDGSKIAFGSNYDNGIPAICIMNADGSNQVNLTNNAADDNKYPSFSPDGSKIVFSSSRYRSGIRAICIMNADGSNQVNLTNNWAEDSSPCFSPKQETTTSAVVEKADYNIGDIGPAGGLIFYINPNYKADGWHYMEAAPVNTEWTDIQWDNRQEVTIDTEIAIGTGKANTQKIVNVLGEGDYAAKLCNDLTFGGCNDWFLPSAAELYLVYENLYLNSLGGFVHDGYWSSSAHGGSGSELGQSFEPNKNTTPTTAWKNATERVRAVRAF